MRTAKIITLLGVLAMSLVLIFAFTAGDFATEGARLIGMPWGIVSLVDLYTGFTLFSGWIIFRESSLGRAILWVILVMVLGFFAASLYAFLALQQSGGNWVRFWTGARA